MKPRRPSERTKTSWDHLAGWYDGWVGEEGSEHHRALAIPLALELLALERDEMVLDVGCGQGALAPAIRAEGGRYTGVDLSRRMVEQARRLHRTGEVFIQGDATRLSTVRTLGKESFEAAVFLLSIQNIDPLARALAGAAWALKEGGRLVIVMTHPCFTVPRQSGWGWDANRKLSYRRVDSYLKPLAVPLKPLRGKPPVLSFHRPLEEYIATLAREGFVVDALREVATSGATGVLAKAARNPQIPTFLGLRARLLTPDK